MPYINYKLPEYPCTEDMWDMLAREARPVVVYGMGNGADKLIRRFEKYGVEIADFFASDGFVRGHFFHGKRVKSFSEIKAEYDDFVIVLSFASNRAEVIEMLAEINSGHTMLVPDMPVAGEDEYFDREFFNSHYDEIVRAYNSLADDESRATYASIINYRLSGKMDYLLGTYSSKDDMYSLISADSVERYIDVGAYNGDTLKEMLRYSSSLKHAVAIEPDPKNFKKLEKLVSTLDSISVDVVNAAAYNECGESEFSVSGNRNSSVNSTSSFEHKDASVRTVTVDSVTELGADYIKYDVEGAELEALQGTAATIEAHWPRLLVSLYHRSRDMFFLVNYLHECYGDAYNFYLRRLLCIPAWEINLIMLPKDLQ